MSRSGWLCRVTVGMLLGLAGLAPPAEATGRPPSFNELADCSPLVVVGTVDRVRPLPDLRREALWICAPISILFGAAAILLLMRRRLRTACAVLLAGLLAMGFILPLAGNLASRWLPYSYRATVRVEEVLRGEHPGSPLTLYYGKPRGVFSTLVDLTDLAPGRRYLLFLCQHAGRTTVSWRHWSQWEVHGGKAQSTQRAGQGLPPVPLDEFRRALAADPPNASFPVSWKDLKITDRDGNPIPTGYDGGPLAPRELWQDPAPARRPGVQ